MCNNNIRHLCFIILCCLGVENILLPILEFGQGGEVPFCQGRKNGTFKISSIVKSIDNILVRDLVFFFVSRVFPVKGDGVWGGGLYLVAKIWQPKMRYNIKK